MSTAASLPLPLPQASEAARARGTTLVVLGLFYLSGMAGLIYEVVWSRLLTYQFGATLDAITAIVVGFLGGLAIGAFIGGRIVDRVSKPLALYGWLEIFVALLALTLPLALEHLFGPLYQGIAQNAGDDFTARRFTRFFLSIIFLMPPTIVMGATLPALARFVSERRGGVGMPIGALYSVNTLGAVSGVYATGFHLIPTFGVSGTMFVAVGLNILVGIVALVLSRTWESRAVTDELAAREEKRRTALANAPIPRWLLYTYAVSGFVALAFQVVWFRALVFNFDYLKNTTYSFSAMLTVYLLGLTIGSFITTPLADRAERPHLWFGLALSAIGLGGLFSFFAIYADIGEPGTFLVDAQGGVSWFTVISILFAKTAIALFPATLAMGMAFPLAARCVLAASGHMGADLGRLYAFNTLGAIFGAFAATFVLVPTFGVGWTIALLSLASLLLGGFIQLRGAEADPSRRYLLAGLPLVLGIVIGARFLPKEFPIRLQTIAPFEQMVYYGDGPLGTIAVVQNSKGERTIYVDNVGVAGTDPILLTDQKSLAHVPMLIVPDPKSVLTVGFGSGGASYSYTLYPELERIDCIEIDPTVPRAASTLTKSNWGIVTPKWQGGSGGGQFFQPTLVSNRVAERGLKYDHEIEEIWKTLPAEKNIETPEGLSIEGYYTFDPRYRIILDDARDHLMHSDVQYDVIATDCTDLRYKTNANLYDLEYFEACKQRLTDDGLVVVWMPLGGLSEEMFLLALRTFARVFPEMTVWYMNNEPTHYCLLLGGKGRYKIDLEIMKKRLAYPGVAADLAELNLDSVDKLLSCHITDDIGLIKYVRMGPINTEDRPILEFESPKFGYGDAPMLDNVFLLQKYATDVMEYVVGDAAEIAAVRERVKNYQAAVPHILQGHAHFRQLEFDQANVEYMKAVELAPDDRAARAHLDFSEVKLLADRAGSPFSTLQLARLYAAQKDRDGEALTYFRRLDHPGLFQGLKDEAAKKDMMELRDAALTEGAAVYERNNQPDEAAAWRARVGHLPPEWGI